MLPSAESAPNSPLFFFAAYAAIFILYWLVAVESRTRLSLRQVIVLGIFARICLLPMAPTDDMARYLWEGRIINLGFDPYLLAPNHPQLEGLRDANWALVNHPALPALYPPLALGLFALLAAISPSVMLFKSAFILLDLLGLGMLLLFLRTEPATARPEDHPPDDHAYVAQVAAVYFLNPLLLLEVAGHGHYESLPLLFCLGFLWALKRENIYWAATFLFLAAASKIAALALVPILLMRFSWRRGALLALAVAIAMGLLIGISGSSPTLGRYSSAFRYNDAVPFLLRSALGWLIPAAGLRALSAALLAGCGLAMMRFLRNASPERQALGFMGLLLAFAPTVHPWYALWVLPFAAPALSRPWLLFSGTVVFTYVVNFRSQVTGKWRELHWLRIPEYVPPVALWICERWRGRSKRDVKSQRSK